MEPGGVGISVPNPGSRFACPENWIPGLGSRALGISLKQPAVT
jgi:hypothetical protein